MTNIIITGNPEVGLASSLNKIYPTAFYASRETGFELTKQADQERFALECLKYDIIINSAALWKFNQTVLLDIIYKTCLTHNHNPRIICIGSTTDRVKKGASWLYNAEKKALRDYCNSLGLLGTWSGGPKISLISFGSLSNVQHKHPDRICLNIDDAASYVKLVIDQPPHLTINEISIDPLQIK